MRRRHVFVFAALILAVLGTATVASAGAPHVPDTKVTATVSGSTLTVAFKESGLGDESQITVQVTAEAHCQNPGGNDPRAGNKASFTEQATVPVMNGKAEGTLSVTAVFQPACSPPMSVIFDSATYQDLTNPEIIVDLTGQL
jgi:hypothetical protein